MASPNITSIEPDQGSVAGGTTLTIRGSGFTGATNVLFKGAIGALPIEGSVSDTSLQVLTPASPSNATGSVSVQVDVPTGLSPITDAASFTYVIPQPVNTVFVVINNTGVADEFVFVKFLGAKIISGSLQQTYGAAQPLATDDQTSSVSYSLAEMLATIPQIPSLSQPMPTFQLNTYSGGRIYFSLGVALANTASPAAGTSNDPDYATVYGYIEPSIFPDSTQGNTNIDISYVDFVGLPISLAIKHGSDGSFAHPPANNPCTTPPGTQIFDALMHDPAVPKEAVVAAATSYGNNAIVQGIARIVSPSQYVAPANAQPYHTWCQPGDLIDYLAQNNISLSIASYKTTDTGASVPVGTLFGFAGSPSKSSPIDTSWTAAQDYSLTANAVPDLNPGGSNPRLSSIAGVSGIKMSGSATVVGAFDIYITNADLDHITGIYGANPPYIVDWTGNPGGAQAYTYSGLCNDLSGRVVGDLLAGCNFGWAASTISVGDNAQSSNTSANLAHSVFATSGLYADTPIGQLSTGQFFYLLSLQPTTVDLCKWFGAAIQPQQPKFYNNYSNDFQALTSAYNMAFTDRLQSLADPDLFFTPSDAIYVEVTLEPGAYQIGTSA